MEHDMNVNGLDVPDRDVSPDPRGGQPPPRGIPPVAEALGWIGGALALAAVVALIARFWGLIGPLGHVGIGVAVAIAGLAGGFILERSDGPAARRLAHFLLAVGVGGVGMAAGFATRYAIAQAFRPGTLTLIDEWAWFAGAASIALAGGLVWWQRRSVMQHLVFGVGVAAAALLALPLIPIEGPYWGAGATLLLVALVWGGLSLADKIPPQPVGLVLSALGVVGALEMMVFMGETVATWPMMLGVAACVALIWAGSRLEQMGVLGIGTVGLMVFTGQLVLEYLGIGLGTAIALIVIGFAALAVGVRFTLRLDQEATLKRRVASEVAGYLGVALAMAGAGILFAQYWDALAATGRVLVAFTGAAVGYGSALAVERGTSGTARRLSQVLLSIGVLSTGLVGAMIAQPLFLRTIGKPVGMEELATSWTFLVGTVTGAVAGGVTWALRKGSLTQIAFISALVMIVISTVNVLGPDATFPLWGMGAIIVAIGATWTVLGITDLMTPVRTALAAGCFVILQGFQMMIQGEQGLLLWAAILAIAFGVAEIVASVLFKRGILLGFGAVMVAMFTMVTLMEQFAGRLGAPLIMLVAGILFIAIAVVISRIAPHIHRDRSESPPTTTPPPLAHA